MAGRARVHRWVVAAVLGAALGAARDAGAHGGQYRGPRGGVPHDRYADVSVPRLVSELVQQGARKHLLVAKIFGGASLLGTPQAIGEGSGLGLALAHQVAREHRGSLTYRSRPGHTVFSMLLPQDENDAAHEAPHGEADPGARHHAA